MKTYYSRNQKIFLAVLVGMLFVVIIVGAFMLHSGGPSIIKNPFTPSAQPEKTVEPFVPSRLDHVGVGDARNAPLVSGGARISEAGDMSTQTENDLTLRLAYAKAAGVARTWSPDAALVYINSLGRMQAGGISSEWQVVFGSKAKKGGYEVLVYNGQISKSVEVPSSVYGFALPHNWYDSSDALTSLRTQPQFATATVAAINFYYNEDGKRWGYALATSGGTVAMPVQ